MQKSGNRLVRLLFNESVCICLEIIKHDHFFSVIMILYCFFLLDSLTYVILYTNDK